MIASKASSTNRRLAHALLATSLTALLASPAALPSGSVGTGAGGISQYGALYKQGKAAFFHKLACKRADCAIKRSQVNAALARDLVASLATRAEVKFEQTETDALISQLCPGEGATGCDGKVDEQEAVQYYLSRRFGVGR